MRSTSPLAALIGGLAAFLVAGALATTAFAQTPTCDKLKGGQRALALELLSAQYPYDCCDDTLASCLKMKPTCRLAWRLSENVCRRVAEGQDRQKIERGLSRRARSMMPSGKPAKIDLAGVPVAGDEGAPVVLVTYACARCPYCSKLMPELYNAVTAGPLKGKARLYFKVFPIRGHEYSKESGLAFMAAAQEGRFWEYALYSYQRFDVYSPAKQSEWSSAVGLDAARFEQRVKEPALRQALVASKKEGIVNKVEATPTLFINGRKFHGDLDLLELIDVVEEELERVKGLEHLP